MPNQSRQADRSRRNHWGTSVWSATHYSRGCLSNESALHPTHSSGPRALTVRLRNSESRPRVGEHVLVPALITQTADEGLHQSVLREFARSDVVPVDPVVLVPSECRVGRELGASSLDTRSPVRHQESKIGAAVGGDCRLDGAEVTRQPTVIIANVAWFGSSWRCLTGLLSPSGGPACIRAGGERSGPASSGAPS